MFWILACVAFLFITLVVVYPVTAALCIKFLNYRNGKRASFRQIFDMIGF